MAQMAEVTSRPEIPAETRTHRSIYCQRRSATKPEFKDRETRGGRDVAGLVRAARVLPVTAGLCFLAGTSLSLHGLRRDQRPEALRG